MVACPCRNPGDAVSLARRAGGAVPFAYIRRYHANGTKWNCVLCGGKLEVSSEVASLWRIAPTVEDALESIIFMLDAHPGEYPDLHSRLMGWLDNEYRKQRQERA